MSLGGGILLDALDPKVYGEKAIASVTKLDALVSIPYIDNQREMKWRRDLPMSMLFGAVGLAVVALVLFHAFIKPLDVTYYVVLRKLGLS